jgi:hypothetical protein
MNAKLSQTLIAASVAGLCSSLVPVRGGITFCHRRSGMKTQPSLAGPVRNLGRREKGNAGSRKRDWLNVARAAFHR